ncbi:MAG: glycosyltransferase family 2 protein, partial [Bacteroidota bacterium]|nr:glycosyltransferase family 2 protein [Bacteroidota bacterium]
GFKMAVLLGNNDIYCRMYWRFDEAVLGFSRNMHEYFGGKRAIMLGFWLIVFAGPLNVWTVWGLDGLYLFVSLVIANRLFVAIAGRQNILGSVLLHPFQMLSFTAIVFYNLFRRIKKETTWKGRKIQL